MRGAAACDALGVPRGRAPIVVACSGGADSGALIHVVRRARPHARLFACYVDHGVRPAAAIRRDVRAVRAQARACRAKVAVLRLSSARIAGTSLEASLRDARYRALARFAASVGAACVLAGHQRDDVAESALLALIRGSGVDGMAAMPPRRRLDASVDLIRPLVWAAKSSLADYAEHVALLTSLDETNADRRYRRNAVRALLADLELAMPGATAAIARSAAIFSDDRALLETVAASAIGRSAAPAGAGLDASALRRFPTALLRRVLRLAVRRATGGVRDFSFDQCAAIADAIKQRRGGSLDAGRAVVELSGGRVTVHAAARERMEPKPVRWRTPAVRSKINWSGGALHVRRLRRAGGRSTSVVSLDGAAFRAGTMLVIRAPQVGDRFVPSGRRTPVSLARFLAKNGLTKRERAVVPLILMDGDIVAVAGVRAGAAYAATEGGETLELRWVPLKVGNSGRNADE